MYGKRLRVLSLAAFAALTATFALVFFYAPLDADQGFIQKIFYVHVPIAIVTLIAYVVGGDATRRCTCARATGAGTCAPTW